MNPLSDPVIVAAIAEAWRDSTADNPDTRHEEGGYIVQNPDGTLTLERWPSGEQFQIVPPALDSNNCYNGRMVVATFHTHPNPPVDESGRKWDQAPGAADKRWHHRRNLRGFVISAAQVFEITPDGNVVVIGKREEVLKP